MVAGRRLNPTDPSPPYMVVIGDREVKQEMIAPRARTGKTLSPLKVEEFIQKIKEETIIGGESDR